MIEIDVRKRLLGSLGEMELRVCTQIKERSFVALCGESGSGKTTLLRILAGLEEAEGSIKIDGEVWLDEKFSMPPQKRRIGFVFQDYALFDNLSVKENLLFVKRDKKLCEHLLEITDLLELKDRAVTTLSGGQKQRVSLCRAMMNRPKLLLMDEPLSALDPMMRAKLQIEILTLHKEFGTTTIIASHQPSEIYKLSSRVIALSCGKIIADGAPKEILLRTNGSQKFSFEGELLEINRVDVIFVAVVAIGQQIVEVVVSQSEAKNLKVGGKVTLSTKAFMPTITPIRNL